MSGTRKISRREVIAYEQKRPAGKPCHRIREAVAEVEVCAMSAASEPAVGNERLAPVRLAKGHLGDVELVGIRVSRERESFRSRPSRMMPVSTSVGVPTPVALDSTSLSMMSS